MLFDDFVERTFLYKSGRVVPWQEPWVGIFHYPPSRSQSLWSRPAFVQSLPTLSGAIALSSCLAEWLRARLSVPVAVVKHPSEIPLVRFDLARYRARPTLVQVGWFLRNQDAIFSIPTPMHKIYVRPRSGSAAREQDRLRHSGRLPARPSVGSTHVQDYLAPADYDDLLARSVIVGEYIDASASNTIVEAMARRTPVIVNRLPALEEYLGPDYPLFYDAFDEIPSCLQDARVAAAHDYLCGRDTSWLDPCAFREGVASLVERVSRA